jgi:hypothetical protein
VIENGADRELGKHLHEAERRIFENPGYLEYLRCAAFRQTLTAVFVANWKELLELLERAASDVGLAIELVQNVHRPDVRDEFQAETVQRLHNYVAGAMTLVDHSRRIMRGRSGPIPDEFAKRKQSLLSNPEVTFVQDLRNFTLHRSLPLLAHTLNMTNVNTPDQQITSEVQLSVAELTSWDGWSSSSRRFLKGQGETIVLRHLIRRHGGLVIAINTWLHDTLAVANARALAEVNRLVVERNAVLSGTDAEHAERLTREWTKMRNTPAAQLGDLAPPFGSGDLGEGDVSRE